MLCRTTRQLQKELRKGLYLQQADFYLLFSQGKLGLEWTVLSMNSAMK